MNTNINLLTPSHHTGLKTKNFLKFFLLVFFMSVFISPKIFSQGDCPGTPQQRGEIIWWLNETSIGSLNIQNPLGVSLNLSAKISAVRGAISNAFSKWSTATLGKVRVTQGTQANHNVNISAAELSGGFFGQGLLTSIIINNVHTWTNNQNIVGHPPQGLPDIYSIMLHEMGHVYGLGDVSSGSTVMSWEDYALKRDLTSCDYTTVQAVYNAPSNIIVQNSFGGGDVKIIDKFGVETSHPSPYTLAELPDTWGWQIKAFDQEFNGWRVFDNWTNVNGTLTITTNPYSIDKGNDTYTADFHLQFTITFQNSFGGGIITVNDTVRNSPYQITVFEDDDITATAISQSIDNITKYFTDWSTGSTNITETFSFSSDSTITANFISIAAQSIHLTFDSSDPNEPITLNWDEYPNEDVTQYQIWRRVRYQQEPTGNPVLLATVSRGTTTYIDYDFYGTNLGFTDWMLWYDVRSYYAPEGTYPNPNWAQVFSGGLIPERLTDPEETLSIIKENTLDNYPNPFNPSTIIQYQIKEGGFVSIKVYDYLGREVAVLVNKEQPSGRYSVTFNASKLSSGVYLYTINAKDFHKVKKMILLR